MSAPDTNIQVRGTSNDHRSKLSPLDAIWTSNRVTFALVFVLLQVGIGCGNACSIGVTLHTDRERNVPTLLFIGGVNHFFERTAACTRGRVPFRSRRCIFLHLDNSLSLLHISIFGETPVAVRSRAALTQKDLFSPRAKQVKFNFRWRTLCLCIPTILPARHPRRI